MKISEFENLRIESTGTCFIDISSVGGHSALGVMAATYLMRSNKGQATQKVEVRKKDNVVVLITYATHEAPIPYYWKDAEILFSWEEALNER